ncbi:MAG TPA: acyltransferase family protein [Candidatus Olsenella avistercoris]|nr:acyltransferase family protein [Candidatus Olsenella avistercoris]
MSETFTSKTTAVAGGRLVYFDALRIVAILLVVFNHLPGYTLYMSNTGPKAWLYMLLTMVTRINVPLFLMVSGALLLGKHESISRIPRHRASRIVGCIGLFGALCYLVKGSGGGASFLRDLLAGKIEGSYWFLYAYLGMLLLLPFLRMVASGLGRAEFRYLLLLHLLLSAIVPMTSYVLAATSGEGYSLNLSLPLAATKQLFYPLVGYYLSRVDLGKVGGKDVAMMFGAALGGIVVSCLFTYHQGVNFGYSQDFVQLFDWVSAIAVFMLFRLAFDGPTNLSMHLPRIGKAVTFLGPLTFGVYLLDPLLKRFLYASLSGALEPLLPTLLVSVCWCLVSFTLGSLITWVLKHVPVVRAIL